MAKTKRAKLYNKLDKNFSLIVRNRDSNCLLCGQVHDVKKLNAHHYIKSKGASTRYRWDLRNLVSLCYACHLYKVHGTASAQYIEPIKKKCLELNIFTEEEYQEIIDDKRIKKHTISELESLVNQTSEFIKKNNL